MMHDDGYPCPVCEHIVFGEEGGYEICPVCDWEDDPSQRARPDSGGGANVLSLNDSKKAYHKQ
ncbi:MULTISPECIES: CPCC family cysteine-rich protein [unclassified Saccharibacter]|uniref:CPCC family cysteine-rich protein n=1 Tax=unclassified Saccharibacter TaxID=2648722 RepID=UPI00192805DD|nr:MULTISPECIES: CPCC family cysteine-rich protein [unclassified Saccharibacter]